MAMGVSRKSFSHFLLQCRSAAAVHLYCRPYYCRLILVRFELHCLHPARLRAEGQYQSDACPTDCLTVTGSQP